MISREQYQERPGIPSFKEAGSEAGSSPGKSSFAFHGKKIPCGIRTGRHLVLKARIPPFVTF